MYSFTTTSDPAMARAFVESLRPRVLKLTDREDRGAWIYVTEKQFNAVPGYDMELIEYEPNDNDERGCTCDTDSHSVWGHARWCPLYPGGSR